MHTDLVYDHDITGYFSSACIMNKKHTNWWGRHTALLKFDSKPSEAAFSAVFSNFDNLLTRSN